ncbi:MAG: epimerase [Verrucomicrobia bacterium]|nr:epimerase [Verrucomicrobiota bacterium]
MNTPLPPLPVDDLDHVLTHTRQLWAGARGEKFFITGGTGFFGMWLLESFVRANEALDLGMHAVVLTRDAAAFARKAPHLAARTDLEFIAGDVRTFPFPPGRFGCCVHAATDARARLIDEQPGEVLEVIVEGTRRVMAFAVQASVKKFLLVSSGVVYGRQPADLSHLPEDYAGVPDPVLPGSCYGEGKRLAENLARAEAEQHGCELKIARCFAFVGPHLPLEAHFAAGQFIHDALRGQPIRVAGDGTPRRSYLYASDLAIWLWTLLFAAPAGRAYNVGSAVDVSIAELAAEVGANSGQNLPVRIARSPVAGRAPARYVPAVERAQAELGLRVRVPLDEAIRKTIAWHHAASALAARSAASPGKISFAQP